MTSVLHAIIQADRPRLEEKHKTTFSETPEMKILKEEWIQHQGWSDERQNNHLSLLEDRVQITSCHVLTDTITSKNVILYNSIFVWLRNSSNYSHLLTRNINLSGKCLLKKERKVFVWKPKEQHLVKSIESILWYCSILVFLLKVIMLSESQWSNDSLRLSEKNKKQLVEVCTLTCWEFFKVRLYLLILQSFFFLMTGQVIKASRHGFLIFFPRKSVQNSQSWKIFLIFFPRKSAQNSQSCHSYEKKNHINKRLELLVILLLVTKQQRGFILLEANLFMSVWIGFSGKKWLDTLNLNNNNNVLGPEMAMLITI